MKTITRHSLANGDRTGPDLIFAENETRALTLADVLIAAPYNAQMSDLLGRLPASEQWTGSGDSRPAHSRTNRNRREHLLYNEPTNL